MFGTMYYHYAHTLSVLGAQCFRMLRCAHQVRLPPEVNRVLYVRNLPYKITAEEMYDIFGKFGAIRQIRV